MEITPEERAQAKEFLTQQLQNMGYVGPNVDRPIYTMNADDPESVIAATIAAHKFLKPNAPKD